MDFRLDSFSISERFKKYGKCMKRNLVKYFGIILIFIFVFSFNTLAFQVVNTFHNQRDYQSDDFNHVQEPIVASNAPNGKSLLIHQYANITEVQNNVNSGENVSFTLYDDWTSQNITINYEGVTQKRDIINNGAFDDNDNGWTFKTNCDLTDEYHSDEGYPLDGCTAIYGSKTDRNAGDYAYFEQNVTLDEELGDGDATFSCYYNSDWSFDQNASVFMSILIGNVEINKSINILNVPTGTWFPLSFDYNPVTLGQVLQGLVTIRVGLILDGDSSADFLRVYLDNFKYEVYTKSNETGILKAFDNQFSQNYTYYNTSFGEGYSFIDNERTPDSDNKVDITIYSNRSGLLGFFIEKITIIAHATKVFNSTVSNNLGSFYTIGENISWMVEFTVDLPVYYDCLIQIEKPIDWSFYEIYSETINKTGVCLGKDYKSKILIIPNTVLDEGSWKLSAISTNYMNNLTLGFWNQTEFVDTSQLTFGDQFRFNVTLNNSISLINTQIECSIYYPNESLFWQENREPTSYSEIFGNFSVGFNMTVGKYCIEVIWTNNLSYLGRDKVGYYELDFIVWHYTNLTAVDFYLERIIGTPTVIKVNFTDYDFDTYIAFATVTYNSTFGQSGSMVYLGSGTYFLDLDTASLELGDYYFSFNASKTYYQNQIAVDLIHLKIIAQPLALEVPNTVIYGLANDYISCQINITGVISGALIWPANISTDWLNPYYVTNHDNGTFTLNFSTWNIPTQGIIETYTISVFASKTDYGNTTSFIVMTVSPIETIAYANRTIVYT